MDLREIANWLDPRLGLCRWAQRAPAAGENHAADEFFGLVNTEIGLFHLITHISQTQFNILAPCPDPSYQINGISFVGY